MTDADLIKAAYTDTIKNIYNVFFDSFAGAGGDAVAESHAEQAFQRGIALARRVRDRALALTP